MNKIPFFLFSITLCFSCTPNGQKSTSAIPTIDIELGVKAFVKKDLSEYASDIRYVRLETDENCLITQTINKIYLEDNRLFVHDGEPYLKVFDALTGEYLYNIGAKGQGAGELPYLTSVDVNPHLQRITFGWSGFVHVFDFEGNFIERLHPPVSIVENKAEKTAPIVAMADENLSAVGFYIPSAHQENAAMVFDREQNVHSVLKSYKDPINPPGISTYSFSEQSGKFYWSLGDLHYYRELSDTIYRFDKQNKSLVPYLVLNFGKHASRFNHTPNSENDDVIKVISLNENNHALFVEFFSKRASPEPFEKMFWRSGGSRSVVSYNFYAVFDKGEKELYCLLQPVKTVPGLNNNIDGGIPFWPKTVTSNNELIDYYHAYEFLECADKLTNVGESVKRIIQEMGEDDNPIVIIAKGK